MIYRFLIVTGVMFAFMYHIGLFFKIVICLIVLCIINCYLIHKKKKYVCI